MKLFKFADFFLKHYFISIENIFKNIGYPMYIVYQLDLEL